LRRQSPDLHRCFICEHSGTPSETVHLTATFLAGACVCLYWFELKRWVVGRAALVATLALGASLFLQPIAQVGLAVFGAAGLFWLALKADFGPLQRINDRWDISYGTYLYGWPAAITILYFDRSISPWALAALTLPAAMLSVC
jgi:peptidoglycan/LPS O-acetylase OafA/YrhL